MKPTYEVVRYRPEFKREVAELQKHLWSADPALNAAYFEWKYEQNPYVEEPQIYLALCEGRVVGMRGMYGAKWEGCRPRRTFLGLCADDFVIAPAHRDRGLATRIMRAALSDLASRGHHYVFNVGASPVTFLGSLAMGWRSAGSMRPMIRHAGRRCYAPRVRTAVARMPFLWRYADRLAGLASADERRPFRRFDRNAARRQNRGGRVVAVERLPRPWAMAELVERGGGDGRIRHVRDEEYFAWRFRSPLAAYRFLFWGHTRLEGYLVLQRWVSTLWDRIGVGIADWEATSSQVRRDLLLAAIELGRFPELAIWSGTLTDEVKTLLHDAGFEPAREEPGRMTRHRPALLVRPVSDELLKTDWALGGIRLLDLGNWDLRMIVSA